MDVAIKNILEKNAKMLHFTKIVEEIPTTDHLIENKKRHLAFMKFISEMYEKRQKRSKNSKNSRHKNVSGKPRSGSMKVQSWQKVPDISRRSSLGILPGSIGIGSGIVMDYPTSSAPKSIASEYT